LAALSKPLNAEMRYSKILDVLYEFLHSGDEVEAQPR